MQGGAKSVKIDSSHVEARITTADPFFNEMTMTKHPHPHRRVCRRAIAFVLSLAVTFSNSPPASAEEDANSGPPQIAEVAPTAIKRSTKRASVAPTPTKAPTKAASKAPAKASTKASTKTKVRPVVTAAPAEKPTKKTKKKKRKKGEPADTVAAATVAPDINYSCAGLFGSMFEATFRDEVFFQGPDQNYECALTDTTSKFLVAVSKQDSRPFTNFADAPENTIEKYGRASISFPRKDSFVGSQISMMLPGGRTFILRGPTLTEVRKLAEIVEVNWPKLTAQQLADISNGECQGTTRKISGPELSKIFGEVVIFKEDLGTPEKPTKTCGLIAEGGDMWLKVLGPSSPNSIASYGAPWRPVSAGVVEYEDFARGVYRLAIATNTLGIVELDAYSKDGDRRSAARKLEYKSQVARAQAASIALGTS
jgi:hypothetical protein